MVSVGHGETGTTGRWMVVDILYELQQDLKFKNTGTLPRVFSKSEPDSEYWGCTAAKVHLQLSRRNINRPILKTNSDHNIESAAN